MTATTEQTIKCRFPRPHQVLIAFTADKHGRPIAYYIGTPRDRWIRMPYDEAKLLVAAEIVREVKYVK